MLQDTRTQTKTNQLYFYILTTNDQSRKYFKKILLQYKNINFRLQQSEPVMHISTLLKNVLTASTNIKYILNT